MERLAVWIKRRRSPENRCGVPRGRSAGGTRLGRRV